MSIISNIGKFAIKHADVAFAAIGTGLTLVGVGLIANETLDHSEEIKECWQILSEKEEKKSKKETAQSYAKCAKSLTRIYLPGSICLSAGLFSILFGHKILSTRYAAAIVTCDSLSKSFKKYRKNVLEAEGREADICYKHDLKAEKIDDEIVYVPKNDDIFIPDRDLSDFAVFFGQEYSELATDSPEMNLSLLKGQEEYANALFHDKGYLMLQEVYDMLGVDRVAPDGIGWVDGRGDNYIDFGIFNVRNGHAVNGNEQVFLLDFNHDGYILPYI